MDEIFVPGTPWTIADLEVRVIDGQPESGFACGDAQYDAFLYQRAWRDAKRGVTVTYLFHVKGMLAAYATLLMDRVRLGPHEKPKGVTYQLIPAMKIAQTAVDRRFAGRGLGKFVIGFSIEYARSLRAVVGCRLVTLDAEPHLRGWYEGQGFVANDEEQTYRLHLAAELGRPVDHLPVSMRFDLRDPVRDLPAGEAVPFLVAGVNAPTRPG
jgi:GNAT superfamily N-acetyltransferase